MSRARINLCGLWRFQPDPAMEGGKVAWYDPRYDCTRWREVLVPNSFDGCCPVLEAYEGAGWFRRTFTVPAAWQGRRLTLCFHGVNYHARVWVNGQEVGENRDGFLPFAFPIQDLVRFSDAAGSADPTGTSVVATLVAPSAVEAGNVVVVRVDNVRLPGEVPGLQRGWRTCGGILREVELLVTDLLYLDDVVVVAEPADHGGRLALRAWARNERPQAVEAELEVQVVDAQGEVLVTSDVPPATIGAGERREFVLHMWVEGARPWSPAQPDLYTARVILRARRQVDGQPVDEQTIRFGFRQVQVQDGALLLNGAPIFLTGFNRHEDSPYHGMAMDLATARQDLMQMKEAGANFVRLCHYPHHPAELDLCDELGMLAMGEIPLYWWDGYAEGQDQHASKLAAARRQLRAMIRRDINHPAILFWSVSNENHEERPEVVAGNHQLLDLVHELDPTRLAVHVSDHWRRDPHFEKDDVICVNAYPSLDCRGYGGQVAYDLAESTRFWRQGLQTLHTRYPGKPILVTEFGYASFEGVFDNAFGEDVQAQAIAAEFAGMDAPYVCGATVWCWADHPWPPATFTFCRYLGISPYGVVTRERRKLQAYWTVRRLFVARGQSQDLAIPFEQRAIPSEQSRRAPPAGPAGRAVFMVRPNLRDIPQIPFPEGFGVRPMRLDEVGLWVDIERDAETYFSVSSDHFYQSFGSDLQAVSWRCFILTDHRGVGVGTISAWYDRDFRTDSQTTCRHCPNARPGILPQQVGGSGIPQQGGDSGVHGVGTMHSAAQEYGRIHWLAVRPAYQGRGLGKAALSFALNQLARWHDRCYLDTQTRRLRAIKLYLDFGFLPCLDMPGAVEAWREVRDQLSHPALENLP